MYSNECQIVAMVSATKLLNNIIVKLLIIMLYNHYVIFSGHKTRIINILYTIYDIIYINI